MTSMITNIRLQRIIDEVKGHTLADIGCDHGIVSVSSLELNKVKHVIACDISNKSLDKARNLAKQKGLTNIEFRCGDGLSVIKEGEVDCVVIAGMGGVEIINILSKKLKSIERYILLAHTHVEDLRQYLIENSLKIEKDSVLFYDNHFYNLIVAEKGTDSLSEKEILLGKDNFNNIDYKNYLNFLLEKYGNILSKCTDGNKNKIIQRKVQIIEEELDESK